MPKIIIVHGAYGSPDDNWIPWLKEKLEEKGYEVVVPAFPTPENQNIESWTAILPELDEDSIVIGHSLGVPFLLNLLENAPNSIKSAYLIAGFHRPLGIDKFDSINESFTNHDFDWEKIRVHCEKFIIFHSDDDPYVPLDQARELADKLIGQLNVISGAGHFNTKSGFSEFPALLEELVGT